MPNTRKKPEEEKSDGGWGNFFAGVGAMAAVGCAAFAVGAIARSLTEEEEEQPYRDQR